jgi:hypothetical protein
MLATTPSGRPPGNGALAAHAALGAISLNTFGTAFLMGARSTRSCVGSACAPMSGSQAEQSPALATDFSRAGGYSIVYAGELVGIAAMFTGFKTHRRPTHGTGAVRAAKRDACEGGSGRVTDTEGFRREAREVATERLSKARGALDGRRPR